VISDAREGLRQAIAQILVGMSWQRCRVRFMRNILAKVPKSAQPEVVGAVRTIFAQPGLMAGREQLRQVATRLAGYPKAQVLLLAAEDDILAYLALPEAHRQRLHSTNALERLRAEIKRRSKVGGCSPTRPRRNDCWERC
jgi:transposase-like protein